MSSNEEPANIIVEAYIKRGDIPVHVTNTNICWYHYRELVTTVCLLVIKEKEIN